MFDPQKRQSSPSSVAQLVARSAVMTARSKQPEGFWFDPRLRSLRCSLLPLPAQSSQPCGRIFIRSIEKGRIGKASEPYVSCMDPLQPHTPRGRDPGACPRANPNPDVRRYFQIPKNSITLSSTWDCEPATNLFFESLIFNFLCVMSTTIPAVQLIEQC